METQLTFHNKPVVVSLSKQAEAQSNSLNSALLIEIQIYFSCMLGKRLAFYTDQQMKGTWKLDEDSFCKLLTDSQKLTDNIYVRFNTVMTKHCPVADYQGPPPVTDFVIKNQKPYVPEWLNIDFVKGEWTGEYGWSSSQKGFSNTRQIRAAAVKSSITRPE